MKTKEIKDKIKFLNGLIAHLKASSSASMVGLFDTERYARTMQGGILEKLKSKGFDKDVIEAINCIDFSGMNYQESENILMSNMIGYRACSPKGEQAYHHSMQNMIDILTDYRENLKEQLEKPIKLLTLIFSAIAAIGTILSFIF